jgi:hypothetical protein
MLLFQFFLLFFLNSANMNSPNLKFASQWMRPLSLSLSVDICLDRVWQTTVSLGQTVAISTEIQTDLLWNITLKRYRLS